MRESLETSLTGLKHRLAEINDLESATAVLGWDQATHMPVGGAVARGRQLATLSRLAHERKADAELGRLLDGLDSQREHLSEFDATLVNVARRDFEKANKVPAEFVARASGHHSESYAAWTRARAENDFASMVPHLRRGVEISRDYAEFFAPFKNIADPRIDDADEGMTVSDVRHVFSELRPSLKALIRAIGERPRIDASCLQGSFKPEDQLVFALAVAERIGYDLERGRLDPTVHPFCTRFAAGDIRITTRVKENEISEAFFSTIHEAGHALYEQGIAHDLDRTPLGHGASAGLHESQARLWENIVGRSRAFWAYWYPTLQSTFPDALRDVSLEAFHAAINKVEPSLIRTDADEVTYNLHIMMRFDLEIDMLEGHLDVRELPNAWRARMFEDVGVVPNTDRDGCLQDVHWYGGYIGGRFQGYTLGNLLSAQLYQAAVQSQPTIPSDIAQGDYTKLRRWLQTEVYQHGRRYQPNDLIAMATGTSLQARPYLDYLSEKFDALYALAPNEQSGS